MITFINDYNFIDDQKRGTTMVVLAVSLPTPLDSVPLNRIKLDSVYVRLAIMTLINRVKDVIFKKTHVKSNLI